MVSSVGVYFGHYISDFLSCFVLSWLTLVFCLGCGIQAICSGSSII